MPSRAAPRWTLPQSPASPDAVLHNAADLAIAVKSGNGTHQYKVSGMNLATACLRQGWPEVDCRHGRRHSLSRPPLPPPLLRLLLLLPLLLPLLLFPSIAFPLGRHRCAATAVSSSLLLMPTVLQNANHPRASWGTGAEARLPARMQTIQEQTCWPGHHAETAATNRQHITDPAQSPAPRMQTIQEPDLLDRLASLSPAILYVFSPSTMPKPTSLQTNRQHISDPAQSPTSTPECKPSKNSHTCRWPTGLRVVSHATKSHAEALATRAGRSHTRS